MGNVVNALNYRRINVIRDERGNDADEEALRGFFARFSGKKAAAPVLFIDDAFVDQFSQSLPDGVSADVELGDQLVFRGDFLLRLIVFILKVMFHNVFELKIFRRRIRFINFHSLFTLVEEE